MALPRCQQFYSSLPLHHQCKCTNTHTHSLTPTPQPYYERQFWLHGASCWKSAGAHGSHVKNPPLFCHSWWEMLSRPTLNSSDSLRDVWIHSFPAITCLFLHHQTYNCYIFLVCLFSYYFGYSCVAYFQITCSVTCQEKNGYLPLGFWLRLR